MLDALVDAALDPLDVGTRDQGLDRAEAEAAVSAMLARHLEPDSSSR